MKMEIRSEKSFQEAVGVAEEHQLQHYYLGADKQYLIVNDNDEIKMFQKITKK